MPTPLQNCIQDAMKKISDFIFREITGIYHIDGGEYNVDEDKLKSFLQSSIERALEVQLEQSKQIIQKEMDDCPDEYPEYYANLRVIMEKLSDQEIVRNIQ